MQTQKLALTLALAFAAPVWTAAAQDPQESTAPKGWFGVTVSTSGTIDESGAASYSGYPIVTGVEAGSPAARAGVQVKDILLSFNSRDMKNPLALKDLLQPGTSFTVRVRRGETIREVRGVIEARPASFDTKVVMIWRRGAEPGSEIEGGATNTPAGMTIRMRAPMPVALPPVLLPMFAYGGGIYPFAGANFTALNDDLRKALGVTREGMFVNSVAPGSPARVSGLRGGDVVLSADSIRIDGPLALVRAIRQADDRSIRLGILRARKARTVLLRW
jgi:Trypsin-like serine proteases, typically periplasmic, contain C-terminal PDZ domain